ncbi:MAG TPA: 50S ribosomal protein L2 [bacterium]|nr:50S ribosomal protein L2 [bacterium]
MSIKKYKPTTAGRRFASVDACDDVTSRKPEKSLVSALKKKSGRNAQGKITVRHQGGGVKKFYREVDFKQDKYDIPAVVKTIEYDPNRNSRIALLAYRDGEKRYIIAPVGMKVGQTVLSSKKNAPIEIGNRLPLEKLPMGTMVYGVELIPGRGAKIARSAGAMVQFMAMEGNTAQLKLPSGEMRLVPKTSMASIGQVGNLDYMHIRLGKAGRKRHMGIRPSVTGKAMNPVDHPHGGGEGHNPIGLRAPKTKWGKKAMGVKTRLPKSKSNQMIVKRRRGK